MFIFGSLFVLFGCLGESSPAPVDNSILANQTQVKPIPNPSISILSPQSGQVFFVLQKTYDLDVSLNYQNLVLKSPGGAKKKGEGNLKYFLDEVEMGLVKSKSFSIPALAIGDHTLRIELFNNDGTPYSPRVFKEVFFSVAIEESSSQPSTEYVVEILDSGFNPQSTTAKVGDSITFVNKMSSPQSALSVVGGNELFNTRVIGPGMNSTVVLTQSGEIEYYSFVRPHVKGRLTVQ